MEYRYKIELVTMQDINEFVKIAANAKASNIKLVDGTGFCVNGRSLLGALAAVEWGNLYCVSDEDIYSDIQQYIRNEESLS